VDDYSQPGGGQPANIEAERAVLGSFIKDPGLLAVHEDRLTPEDYFHEPHRHIYTAIQEVSASGTPITIITLGEALHRANLLEAVGGATYLGDLQAACATTAGLEHYIKIVHDKSLLRRMIAAATAIATKGYSHDVDLTQFLDDAEREVFSVSMGVKGSPVRHIEDVLAEAMENLHKQLERGEDMAGVSSGFDQLDKIMMGLQKSDLIILAARPGMGKTSFALCLAGHVGLYEKRRVAIFSLEMAADQLAMRLLAADAHVGLKEIRAGRPTMEDFRRLTDAMGRLSQAGIFIDDTPAITLAQIRSRCRKLALQGGLDLIVIDYLQLMRPSDIKLPREQQISEMSRGLKALAKELHVPVICLSQLNRGLESRQDKRPILSDLRESGAIEQDADVIIFVYRDDYYHPDSDDQGVAEIIVGKQRNGPTDTARVSWLGQYTKFANLTTSAEF
jgi:replicative DNA helicase